MKVSSALYSPATETTCVFYFVIFVTILKRDSTPQLEEGFNGGGSSDSALL